MGLDCPIAIQWKSSVHDRSQLTINHTLENLLEGTSKDRRFRSQVEEVNAENADVWLYQGEWVEAGRA